jgi:threonine dehydratase
VVDLTGNEMAKAHARYLSGGRAPHVQYEKLYRFIFPERPGALHSFLTELSQGWNVSLFHYRNQGGDMGRVLVGLQVRDGLVSRFLLLIQWAPMLTSHGVCLR